MLEGHKLVMIYRGVYGDILLRTVEALYKGDIRLAEITFDQKSRGYKETLDTITMLKERFRGRMVVRAGTVVNPTQVELACRTKAAYIISPNVDKMVIRKTKELGMLSTPGALSPSEVLGVHEYGADYVKLFPAARITTSYIKNLTGPISHVKFIATTGITEESIAEFTTIGCTGYDINGRLMNERVIQEGRFEELQHRARTFIVYLQKEEG